MKIDHKRTTTPKKVNYLLRNMIRWHPLVVGKTHLMKTVPYKRKSRNHSKSFKKSLENSPSESRKLFYFSRILFYFSRNLSASVYFLSKHVFYFLEMSFVFRKVFISTRFFEHCFLALFLEKSFFLSISVFSFRIISNCVAYLSNLYPVIRHGFHKGRYSSAWKFFANSDEFF